MSFEQEKMIVGSLPSLYPLQKFEEEAINALVSLPIDDDTISRKATTEAIEKCHKQCCRIDSCGDEWIHYETTLNEVESIPPMSSNTSNVLEALDSVNATQSNALDSISRQAAINALETTKRIASHGLHGDGVLRTFNDVLNSLINIINLLPQTQPEHIRGRWIPVGGALYQCDQCGAVSLERKFCSDCGAEMDRGVTE